MTHFSTQALPIVILAAGSSRRMRGKDKLLEHVDGKPMLRRQADIARAATKGPVYVTLPVDCPTRENALDGCDVNTVSVPNAHHGMSASLRQGLSMVPPDTRAVMILLADLPELSSADLIKVRDAVDLDGQMLIWRGATSQGKPGHPIVFAQSLFAELSGLSGDNGGAGVVARHSNRMCLVPLPTERARRDLDTPEAWAEWRKQRAKNDAGIP
ncbi:MAG: nucleotidyltransferase family protein [Roseobacter sp.]